MVYAVKIEGTFEGSVLLYKGEAPLLFYKAAVLILMSRKHRCLLRPSRPSQARTERIGSGAF